MPVRKEIESTLTAKKPCGEMPGMTSPSRPVRRLYSLARALVVVLLALGTAGGVAWMALTDPEARELSREMAAWAARIEDGAVASAAFTIEETEGLPKDLAGHEVLLRWKSPDRLGIRAAGGKHAFQAGRDGSRAWFFQPDKGFALVADNETPRFTGDAASVQAVDLPEFRLPVSPMKLRLLPAFVGARREGEALVIGPNALGRRFLDAPDFTLTRAGDRVELRFSRDKRLSLRVQRFACEDEGEAPLSWGLPAEAEPHATRVALSHLKRCAEVMLSQWGAKTPALPPAEGRREVVGRSRDGAGRLESHDGVRVLFLSGAPEEMGRQQGELLRPEVRAVVDRILYGVGVGSSFAKGRWFFGEIESAQARLEPFIPEPYLKEMDALAASAGLHPQEARLANFFPELFHCSGFAVHGSATVDGQMYHGRILDYIRGAGLEDNAVVMVIRPDGGNAWVNVSYAGFIGSVTAMNEKQLAIGEMGGKGEGHWDGKPMAQLVREVMERCGTIDEAVELMRNGPRTCEYYYVISDAKSGRAVGIKATPEIFETVWSGESHPQLPDPVADTVLLSAGDRYGELVRRVKAGFGTFDAGSARDLMTRPVCMTSNIQSVLFAPGTLDFWVANADGENVASHTRYTHFNLRQLLADSDS